MKRCILVCSLVLCLAVMVPMSHATFISTPGDVTIGADEDIELYWTFENELGQQATFQYNTISIDFLADGQNTELRASPFLGPLGPQVLDPGGTIEWGAKLWGLYPGGTDMVYISARQVENGTYTTKYESGHVLVTVSENEPIPEPGTLILLGTGLTGLAGYGVRRRKKA